MDLGEKLGENGIFCQVGPVAAQKVWDEGLHSGHLKYILSAATYLIVHENQDMNTIFGKAVDELDGEAISEVNIQTLAAVAISTMEQWDKKPAASDGSDDGGAETDNLYAYPLMKSFLDAKLLDGGRYSGPFSPLILCITIADFYAKIHPSVVTKGNLSPPKRGHSGDDSHSSAKRQLFGTP